MRVSPVVLGRSACSQPSPAADGHGGSDAPLQSSDPAGAMPAGSSYARCWSMIDLTLSGRGMPAMLISRSP